MLTLDQMIANPQVRARLGAVLDAPQRILAVTGADASGKATTMYSLARILQERGRRVTLLVQDHVLPTEAPKLFVGLDVRMVNADAAALQSALAAVDSDVIVVIDQFHPRTSHCIVDAAKGGRTILTMLSTPFVGADCAYTLEKMGVSTEEFLGLFSFVLTQHLLPALCEHCRRPVQLDMQHSQLIRPGTSQSVSAWEEGGCDKCSGTGVGGRTAAHELLVIDDASRPVLAEYLEHGDLKNPLPQGYVSLSQSARELVLEGQVGIRTFQQEIVRNPLLRMQHQWEQERRLGADAQERLTRLRRFFSPGVAELILSGSIDDPLKTRRREIVVLFLDLRGFTAFAETSDPEDVMHVLGEYHAAMGELVMAQGATLERFAGDGMMIFLNDPMPVPEPAKDAVQMAMRMQRRFDEVRKGWRKRGIDLGLGIGIAQGYATIGAIGYEGRRDYGAIGVVGNLASRLCSEARDGQVLVSQRVWGAIEDVATAEQVGPLSLKGFHAPVPAWSVQWRDAAPS